MKKRTIIFGAVMAGTFFSNAMAKNTFGSLGSGSEVRSNLSTITAELKCGEGKADSTSAKTMDAKCGEGKCGDKKTKMEAKCGEGKCGDKKATMDKTKDSTCGNKATMTKKEAKKAKSKK